MDSFYITLFFSNLVILKMHLTQSEKIRLVRWRLHLTQYQFFGVICCMGEARYIENRDKYAQKEPHLKNDNILWCERKYSKSYNRTIAKLEIEYGLDTGDLTLGEKAKILRERSGDTMKDAGKKFNRSYDWIVRAERGVFFKYKKTSQNNAQELYDFYDSNRKTVDA